MSDIEIQVSGIDSVEEVFRRIEPALDTTGILDEVTAVLLARIRRRFLEQTDPEGNIWPRSAAAIMRERKGRGGDTLFDTGRLFHSIQLFAQDEDWRAIGTDVPYGVRHQLGLGGLPRRAFMGVNDDDSSAMFRVVVNRIAGALKNG